MGVEAGSVRLWLHRLAVWHVKAASEARDRLLAAHVRGSDATEMESHDYPNLSNGEALGRFGASAFLSVNQVPLIRDGKQFLHDLRRVHRQAYLGSYCAPSCSIQ